MAHATPGTPGPTDRKAVLICPACGHEAPYDDAWSVDDAVGCRTDITCPACGAVVVSQPRFDGRPGRRSSALVRPVLDVVHAVVGHDVR